MWYGSRSGIYGTHIVISILEIMTHPRSTTTIGESKRSDFAVSWSFVLCTYSLGFGAGSHPGARPSMMAARARPCRILVAVVALRRRVRCARAPGQQVCEAGYRDADGRYQPVPVRERERGDHVSYRAHSLHVWASRTSSTTAGYLSSSTSASHAVTPSPR